MKTISLIACLFVAGALASFAVAGPPPGKGKPQPSTTGTTTTHGKGHAGKVTLCHKAGPRKWVKVRVSKNSVKAHLKRGDVEPGADGSCPTPPPPTTTTTTAAESA